MITNLHQPTLLLNESVCRRNIQKMVAKAKKHKLRFRPHFKTHQSRAIGQWFREAGTKHITVSSVSMGLYFAEDGWKDITLAFPVNHAEIHQINHLASLVQLNLVVESTATVEFLNQHLKNPVGIYVKVDVGAGRTGIQAHDHARIAQLVKHLTSSNLQWLGWLAHAGHTYQCRSKAEVVQIHSNALQQLRELTLLYLPKHPHLEISIGDSPSATVATDFDGVHEMRPGVFVFYDLMQEAIGVCTKSDQALCLACPVVALHPDRNEVVVYAGAIHLSKESLTTTNGIAHFGQLTKLTDTGWESASIPDTYLTRISQEHGIIRTSAEEFAQFQVGQWVGILPVHACLTANLMGSYQGLSGTRLDHMNERKWAANQELFNLD